MTYPKKLPCPKCGAPGDELAIYKYDSLWAHVECDNCYYLGPGEGTFLQAIRSHNTAVKKAKEVAG